MTSDSGGVIGGGVVCGTATVHHSHSIDKWRPGSPTWIHAICCGGCGRDEPQTETETDTDSPILCRRKSPLASSWIRFVGAERSLKGSGGAAEKQVSDRLRLAIDIVISRRWAGIKYAKLPAARWFLFSSGATYSNNIPGFKRGILLGNIPAGVHKNHKS